MGTPNKYSPYSHSCNPPPITLPPHFGGESQRHPLTPPYPPPYQRVEPQDPPHLKHRKSWGAREGKGGCPHPIHPQAPPQIPAVASGHLWEELGGAWGREGGREGSPQLDHHPKFQVSESCWLKTPPAPEGTGDQHHPCRQGQSGEGSRGVEGGRTKCGSPKSL